MYYDDASESIDNVLGAIYGKSSTILLLCSVTLTIRVLLYFTSIYLHLYLLTLGPVYSPIALLSHTPQFFVLIFHLRSKLQLQFPLRALLTTMCSLVSRMFV